MKKLLLLLALAVSGSAMGQTYLKSVYCNLDNRIVMIPKVFSYQNEPLAYIYDDNYDFVVYDKNFEEVKRFNSSFVQKKYEWRDEPIKIGAVDFSLYDFDTFADDGWFYLSQTLFNNDEKFEYIMPVINEENNYSGFEVKSEDGTVLSSITIDESNYDCCSILKLGDNVYLAVYYFNNKVGIYRIDRETSSLQKVKAVEGLNIQPRMPKRHEMVTVEMDEVSSADRELQVVNAAGQTVDRVVVPAGSRQVQLSASHMSPGVNVIKVGGTDASGNYKIFVK